MDLDQAVTAALASGHLAGILPSSVSETKVIQALIAASEEKIAQIDSQIRDLQCMRGRESGRLAWLKLGISPIRKLPDEMLTNIIRHAHTDLQSSFWLSQVCWHWRELAHRTPALWTSQLPLRVLTVANPPHEYIAAIEAYVQRSNPLPISLDLRGAWDWKDAQFISPAVADALLVGASRWVCLAVNDYHVSVLQALVQLPRNALKMLERANLSGGHGVMQPIYAFLSSPLLRRVFLSVAHTVHFPMPWAQLTELELSERSSPLWIDILLQCTNLVHAKVCGNPEEELEEGDWDAINLISATVVTLSFLETLELSLPTDMIAPCFGRLSLPSLRKLDLSVYMTSGYRSATTSAIFSQFQDRSPNIEKFSLAFCEIDSEGVHSILLHAPNLTDFHLDCCRHSVDDYVLEEVQRFEEDLVHLVPRLERLLLWVVDDAWTEERLLAMIKSRWWTMEELHALPALPPVARLQRVDISRTDSDRDLPFSESFQQEISRLKAQGLDVEVR
ncbi:hypothetical protein R3P38DRAFT_3026644 [Favolaschia claudopus]|uniref:F-box domain-containing protein n=1 Tax=Favolaschia claudopus TaxID=2862362 RepID=A0AAW0AEW3_9AGAR